MKIFLRNNMWLKSNKKHTRETRYFISYNLFYVRLYYQKAGR